MPERVPTGLRPDAEPVRAGADRDARQQLPVSQSRSRRRPRCSAPRATAPCRRPTRRPCRGCRPGDPPLPHDLPGREADHARSIPRRGSTRRASARRGSDRARAPRAGVEEADDAEATRVDLPEAVRHHVGDVERAAVGRQLHVLRHRREPAGSSAPDDARAAHVDLDKLARELAARRALASRRPRSPCGRRRSRASSGIDEPDRIRVAEVEPLIALGDDDRVAAVGGE